MADIEDVATAVATLINASVYPTGIANPSTVGAGVRIGDGWPVQDDLTNDLAAGIANVTVINLPNMSSNTTRYDRRYTPLPDYMQTPVGITATVDVNSITVTLAGTVTSGLTVGILFQGTAYTYDTTPTDTLATIATALAAQIAGATASGAVVTLPALPPGTRRVVQVGVGAPVICSSEVSREIQWFQITLWCPSVELRKSLGALIRPLLADQFIPLADGTLGWIRPGAQSYDDKPQRANLWVRHMRCSVEYGTTVTKTFPPVLFSAVSSGISVNGAPLL